MQAAPEGGILTLTNLKAPKFRGFIISFHQILLDWGLGDVSFL